MTENKSGNRIKVAVAMSGGVDSSVAAALLVQAGYAVVGFTLKLWDAEDDAHARKVCCTTVMARDAGMVCRQLGIPHYTLDLRERFRTEVIDRFEWDYIKGLTPNPCVHCNSRVKWGALWEWSQRLGFSHIATGHYARIAPGGSGGVRLMCGADNLKDQSYFLWAIPRALLERTLFPLGELDKTRVRDLARRLDLPVADKEESQEVCFVPADDYRGWLKKRRPELTDGELAGELVDRAGNILGRHPGYPFFTIGQRRGLGTGGGRKWFVTAIEPMTKRVYLGDEEDLNCTEFRLNAVNLLTELPFGPAVECRVKVRYRDPGVECEAIFYPDGRAVVRPVRPLRAVAPGQSAVFYRGDTVLGGGIIDLRERGVS